MCLVLLFYACRHAKMVARQGHAPFTTRDPAKPRHGTVAAAPDFGVAAQMQPRGRVYSSPERFLVLVLALALVLKVAAAVAVAASDHVAAILAAGDF